MPRSSARIDFFFSLSILYRHLFWRAILIAVFPLRGLYLVGNPDDFSKFKTRLTRLRRTGTTNDGFEIVVPVRLRAFTCSSIRPHLFILLSEAAVGKSSYRIRSHE